MSGTQTLKQDPVRVASRSMDIVGRRNTGRGPRGRSPTHSHHGAFSGLNDAHTLVAAGGAEEAAIPVPVHAVDGVRMHIGTQGQRGRPGANIPYQDHVVTT